jgi:lipopolysaccharide export system protein LptC
MDRYSRIVAILKVVFPLSALALLSVLFLLSNSTDFTVRLPFAEDEIAKMTREQRVTAPDHAAVTENGDRIKITATQASPGDNSTPANAASIHAQLDIAKGGFIRVTANKGQLKSTSKMARFIGNVHVVSSQGYDLQTNLIDTAIDRIHADAPGNVHGLSPMGTLVAGSMTIRSKNDDGSVHMVFTNGVKLVYQPKQPERP